MTRQTPVQLQNLVEMPKTLQYIWQWFLELNATRPSGFGIGNIQYLEMQAYFNLHHITPEAWEIGVLKLFDSIAVSVAREQDKKPKPKDSK